METNPNIELRVKDYLITIFSGASDPIDEDDDNLDIQVSTGDGEYYTATFFTLKNLETLFRKNAVSGDFASGSFFFCRDMIIVKKLNVETVKQVVSKLIERDELATAFDRHSGENS